MTKVVKVKCTANNPGLSFKFFASYVLCMKKYLWI